jgi:hypothetical protein
VVCGVKLSPTCVEVCDASCVVALVVLPPHLYALANKRQGQPGSTLGRLGGRLLDLGALHTGAVAAAAAPAASAAAAASSR